MKTVSPHTFSFDRDTRTPYPLPPPGTVDCQIHIYDEPSRYPLADGRAYDPQPDANFNAAQRMHAALGIMRAVIVQPTCYATDHRLLLDCLKRDPNYRGTAIINDSVSDAEIAKLHAAGVRGARFNFASDMGAIPETSEFERSVERIKPYGWHVKIRSRGDEILAYAEVLKHLARVDIQVVFDHMGSLQFARGVDQPACCLMLNYIRSGWWVKLSNPDRHTNTGFPWADAVEIAQAFIDAAPDRVVWGSDWPHTDYRKPVPNDADLLEIAYRYAPEPMQLQKLLVDNPARLYDYPPVT